MNEERQLPLIKRFMLQVAPEVIRHRYEILLQSETPYLVTFDPEAIAQSTLALAIHLAGAYARCYDSFYRNEKDSTAPGKQKTSDPAEGL
jgi:hypothetical protein